MRHISENSSIALWIKKACGCETTARNYLNSIKHFFVWSKITPDELVSTWKKAKYNRDARQKERFIDDWTEKIERYVYINLESLAPLTINTKLSIVISFFKHHRIPIYPEYKKHAYVKYHNRDLRREEIKRILQNADMRDRTFFLMMVESGLRPNTLVQLRYKHIKKDFETGTTPMMIELPSELLKDRVEARWTFIGEDAYKTLKEYLKPKLPLENEDLIFTPERSDVKHPHLMPQTFTNKFRKIALKLGISETEEKGKPRQVRLYGLRKFFMNNVRYEGFDHTFKEFWMCHQTTQTHYVSRDPEIHREEYSKVYENLRIYKSIDSAQANKIEEQSKRIEQMERQMSIMQDKIQTYEKTTAKLLSTVQKLDPDKVSLESFKKMIREYKKMDEKLEKLLSE